MTWWSISVSVLAAWVGLSVTAEMIIGRVLRHMSDG